MTRTPDQREKALEAMPHPWDGKDDETVSEFRKRVLRWYADNFQIVAQALTAPPQVPQRTEQEWLNLFRLVAKGTWSPETALKHLMDEMPESVRGVVQETEEEKTLKWEKDVIWQCSIIQDQPSDKETFVSNWLRGTIKIPDEVFVRKFGANKELFDSVKDKVLQTLKETNVHPVPASPISEVIMLRKAIDTAIALLTRGSK